ncbi:hypothetical protein GCM10025777_05740 [Membranihabitans marinus]
MGEKAVAVIAVFKIKSLRFIALIYYEKWQINIQIILGEDSSATILHQIPHSYFKKFIRIIRFTFYDDGKDFE